MGFAYETTQYESVARVNITPLVDVMLVLLVIFMIAAPMLTQRIELNLPGVAPKKAQVEPPPIELRIDAAGQLFWNGSPIPTSALQAMLEAERRRDGVNSPILRVDPSGEADYGAVARALAAANNADWERIAFIGK